jgi:BolA family transcriptional regulator, general stress-responsive regulator
MTVESYSLTETIQRKLAQALMPAALEVIDESHQHAGHGGWREGQTTHVRIRVTSAAFAGKSRVAMHRTVNDLLADEIAAGLHAVAIEAKAL